MDNNSSRPIWMEDESVKNISLEKLDFLEKIFKETRGKSQKEMLTYLMPMLKQAKQQNLTFTTQEMNAAISAIKKHSSKEELEQINKILEKGNRGK